MNDIATLTSIVSSPAALPAPRCDVAIRAATMNDLPFMDGLQKKHSKQLGYFPTKQFEDYIEMGAVLVAEDVSGPLSVVSGKHNGQRTTDDGQRAQRVGYCIAKDRYLKRDELGVVYQLCVAPGDQRKLVGATLVKAVFDRAAYGCRLFCCWCAQDLEANRFWESLGFIPLAFRAGSTGKRRVHIFWQRRIVADDEITPLWYPFQTNSGAIREDRIVFPIPPGVHWKEVRAVTVPTRELSVVSGQLPVVEKKNNGRRTTDNGPAPGAGKVGILVGGRIKYVDRPGAGGAKPVEQAVKPPRKKAEKPPKPKYDPKYLAAARELRDRCLEHVNDPGAPGLPSAQGKYDVSRTLSSTLSAVERSRLPSADAPTGTRLLPAA